MGALKTIETGVASLLNQFETEDWLAGEAAKAIVLWVLTHERVHEAFSEAHNLGGQIHAVSADLQDILHRVLRLPLD